MKEEIILINYLWDLKDMTDEEHIIVQFNETDELNQMIESFSLDAPIVFGDINSDTIQKWLPIINDIAKKNGYKKVYHYNPTKYLYSDSQDKYLLDIRNEDDYVRMTGNAYYEDTEYSVFKYLINYDTNKNIPDGTIILLGLNEYLFYEKYDISKLEEILQNLVL